MKLKKGMEQSVCVLLMLALEKDHQPVKSKVMSDRLGVSDSYLKKILRQLVVEKLIVSDASKDGGFQLARPIDQITMLDVYWAIEGRDSILKISHLARRVFVQENKILQAENDIMQVISEGEKLFLEKLDSYPLANLLAGADYHTGVLNWEYLKEVDDHDQK